MNIRLRRWQARPRRIALIAVGALAAAGLSAVSALPAQAAVSCQVDYTLRSVWPTGFTADLTLHNLGDPLTAWTLTFAFPGNAQISQPPWNAGNWSQTGQNVSISNASWNGTVATGGVVSGVGFNAAYSGTNVNPTAFSINGTPCNGGGGTTPQLVVTPTSVSVPEGGTRTFAVHLTAAPTANVTVATTAGTGDADLTVSAGASLTFTPANFATDQTVTLAAAEDADTTNGTRTFAVASTGMTSVNVTATEADNDTATQSLIVTPTAVSVPEGGTATYSVRLAVAPTANVTVTNTAATTGDADLTVSAGGSLTFTTANFATPQNVTLRAAEDTDTTNGTRNFTVASAGLTSVTVAATEADNDVTAQSLIVTPTTVSVPEGSTATYSVRLAVAPTANVTVTNTAAATGDTDITVSAGASLTFTPANFATPQNVTLAGAEDADTTNGSRNITVASSGLTSVTVTANESDNDVSSQALVVTPTAVTVAEGSSAQYSVRLAIQPTANVTVTSTAASGGDADLTISAGASLTFTTANWNVTQTVTVAAAEDADTTNGTRTITVASTGLTSVTVTATEQDNDGTQNVYLAEFMNQYNKLHSTTAGYFSPEGVPYHGIETLIVEAPDHGHETTSEAFSYYVWLEANFGRITGDWSKFNTAWTTLETYDIPTAFVQGNYNPSDPADYAPEFPQPSSYPAPLDPNIDTGNDPLYNELVSTYGNASVYGMHWLIDVDNVYGYGQAVSSTAFCHDTAPASNPARVVYINTFQRGPQESTWETVAHPSCETFAWGAQNNGGFAPLFVGGTAAQQWRFTDAPDADARAIQASYWALQWATAQGKQSQITASLDKAAKMGDYLRYAFYDKYFKVLGCASTTCATSTGKENATGLLAWYYAFGGASDNAWSWRIGASHNHSGYQNPLAAFALSTSGPSALRPKSPTAGADWTQAVTRQLQFITWLQSGGTDAQGVVSGAIAGGATNSWNGNYSARPAGVPQFFGMTYDVAPVYLDPPSNQWFGFQCWGVERMAEYYNVTGDANAKAILDKWVTWAIAKTTLGSGSSYQIPSTLSWTGQPSASFSSATGMPGANPGLTVNVVDFTQDVGVTAAYVKLLTYYAAKAGATSGLGKQAHDTAKGLLDRMLMLKDSVGIAIPEQRTDYNRFDDIWTSSNQTGLFIPSGYSGKMPNGDTITPGKSFEGIRTFYTQDPNWAQTAAYMAGTGPAPTFTFHRFWAQADIAMALADFGSLFPNG
jgi:hypothetical protein